MKNNMVFVLSFFSLFAQAMEKENTWSITAYGTKITLHKGDMVSHYAHDKGKENIVICTGHTQDTGIFGMSCIIEFPGKCHPMGKLNSKTYSAEDGEWEYFCLSLRSSCRLICPKQVYARAGMYLVSIEEPWLYKKNDEPLFYRRECRQYNPKEQYYGNEALEQYREEASLCYKILLNDVKMLYSDVKNIVISALGRGFKYYKTMFISQEDISLIAIKSILEYVKSAPNMYDNLELFVDDDADVDLCKHLLLEFLGFIEKFSLVLLAHKESGSIVALLPNELISHIALLYNTVHCT